MFRQLFEKYKDTLPIVGEKEVSLYEEHFCLLKKWNEKIGLVSRKSIEQSFSIHYADCIFISDFAHSYASHPNVFDLGSGAGFPGLIFAIRYPEKKVFLFEKMLKKQTFLSAAINQLKLENVELSGAMFDKKREGLFLGRAVLPREELFPFMKKRMAENSRLVTNLGAMSEKKTIPNYFKLIAEQQYALPENSGNRRVEMLEIVSRGTTRSN